MNHNLNRLEEMKALELTTDMSTNNLLSLYDFSLKMGFETLAVICQNDLLDRNEKAKTQEVFLKFAQDLFNDQLPMFNSLVLRLYGEESDGPLPDVAIEKATNRFFRAVY
ncbi:hypothetical protein IJJ05_01885 [Candidatus Saccharibacteria bacterium]|nr:hypothetical protein [Candidatus Saccharibacteria bacterium]